MWSFGHLERRIKGKDYEGKQQNNSILFTVNIQFRSKLPLLPFDSLNCVACQALQKTCGKGFPASPPSPASCTMLRNLGMQSNPITWLHTTCCHYPEATSHASDRLPKLITDDSSLPAERCFQKAVYFCTAPNLSVKKHEKGSRFCPLNPWC